MLRDWLRAELEQAFERQGDNAIVVWYDVGGTLGGILPGALPEGISLLRFEGSYLALRFALEEQSPELEGVWLIYVPEEPPAESWLRDYELLGERLELDLLSLLQRRCGLAVTPLLVDLLRNHPENSRRLAEEWERLVGSCMVTEGEILRALLTLAFGLSSWDLHEAALVFLCSQGLEKRLKAWGLWQVWRRMVQEWLGWEDTEVPPGERALQERICATVLLADLVHDDPSLLRHFPFLPADPHKRQSLRDLARRWRDSVGRRAVYCEAAREVENRYNLKGIVVLSKALLAAETFRSLDELWAQELRKAVCPDGSNFGEKAEQLQKIAEARKTLFWSQCDVSLKGFWEALELAAKIWLGCEKALQEAERLRQVDAFVKFYTDEGGWWQLDLWVLQLAVEQVSLEAEDRERFVQPAWVAYRRFLDLVNRAFMDAVRREGWQPTQTAFWQNVHHGRERVAIFFVDALRFDLARFLQECMANTVSFGAYPLKAVLPSITELGMAALLLEGEGPGVSWEDGRLVVRIGGRRVTERNERKDFLESSIGVSGKVVALDELERVDLSNIRLLVVFSRELDEFGTFVSDLHPQGIFEMVQRIAQGIRIVASKGFRKVFVVADHGFLFAPETCEPSLVRVSSEALRVKRRFVIGGQQEGCWVVRASEVGLQGDLIFAFPEGFSILALPGERETFLHGGLSLQESVIPMLFGQVRVAGPKVAVSMRIQEPVSSRLLRVTVEAQAGDLFAEPRKVKVRVGKHESVPVEASSQKPRQEISFAWLDGFEPPPERIVVQLLDAETGQVLEAKEVPVQLLL